jgi:IS30 family transposase
MRKQGCTQKMIADAIGKDKSVISRELKRNANNKGLTPLDTPRIWQNSVRSV